MSRIHNSLRKVAQPRFRPPEVIRPSAVAAKDPEIRANPELRSREGDPALQEGSTDSRSSNGHLSEVHRRALAPGVGQTEKKDLAPSELRNGSQAKEPGQVHCALSEQAREQVSKLVQRLFVFANSCAPRVVVFSNVDKGTGSSEMCFYTGQVLAAQTSKSVCIVDANGEMPSLHRSLGVGKLPGLSEAINNSDPIKNFAVQMAGANLWLLPAGSPGVDGHRFSSDRMSSRIGELREEFEYVLIDAPPVSSAADAVLLGQMADGVIVVVEANATRRETARAAKETLQGASVKLLGAILNNRTFPIPEAIYRKLSD